MAKSQKLYIKTRPKQRIKKAATKTKVHLYSITREKNYLGLRPLYCKLIPPRSIAHTKFADASTRSCVMAQVNRLINRTRMRWHFRYQLLHRSQQKPLKKSLKIAYAYIQHHRREVRVSARRAYHRFFYSLPQLYLRRSVNRGSRRKPWSKKR